MSAPSGFQFKQFFIEHTKSAMKVGTDSIMLGSWTEPKTASTILDIGTGSGLLAVMMAQKSLPDSRVTGLDINPKAIEQATANGANSPWGEKLYFVQSKIQDFQGQGKFDLIISNPPYFSPKPGALNKSDPQYIEHSRRQARHTLELSYVDLLSSISRLLANTGQFTCVLPNSESAHFLELANNLGLYCEEKLQVVSAPTKAPTRVLLKFTFDDNPMVEETIVVRDLNLAYTKDYKNLCKDFYLNF